MMLSRAKKYWVSILLIVLSGVLLFIPLTYFGFLSYMVKNSVVMLNIAEMTEAMVQASVGLYNGMVIKVLPVWVVYMLAVLGGVCAYMSVYLVKYHDNKRAILRKDYWLKYN